MAEVDMPNDGTEDEDDGDVTVKVKKSRRNGASNGVAAATPEAIKGFANMFASGGRHFNVFRKSGPKGPQHKFYRGRPIQLGFLKTKLPPEAAEDLVSAVDEVAGGGIYRIAPDGAKPNEVLENVVIPGRPKPIDLQQAADDEADIEEGLLDNEALPHLGSGGLGGGGLPPFGLGGGLPQRPAPMPGYTWDPIQQRHVPLNPFVNGMQNDAQRLLERENAELKMKATYEPLVKEIADLREKAKHPSAPSESPFKGVLEMITMQNQEAERQRAHQLTIEREERNARATRDDADRKTREAREDADRKAREERDREDRREREADRKAMVDLMTSNNTNLVKLVTSDNKSSKADPIEAMVKMITVMSGIKDLTSPPGKSETAEMIEASTAGAKEVVGALGEAFRGRKSEANPNAPPTDERLQLLDVMDYMGQLATAKIRPKDAFVAFTAFCAGRGYDAKKMVAKLAENADAAAVAKLAAELKEQSTSSLVPEQYRAKLGEVAGLLGNAENQAWLVEVGGVARG